MSKRIIAYAILSGVLALLFMVIAIGVLHLNARQFAKELYAQNFRLIEAGDAFSLLPQLNSISSQETIYCIKALKDDSVFFGGANSCNISWFYKDIWITGSNSQVKIYLRYGLPFSTKAVIVIVYFLAVLSSGIILKLIYRLEDIRSQHIRTLNDLARRVAHDIRSPLSAITVLSGAADLNSADARALLKATAVRIGGISQDLIERSKKGLDESFKVEPVKIDQVVQEILQEKNAEYEGFSDIIFEKSLNADLDIFSNQKELARAISNLINNSVEAKGENPLRIMIRSTIINSFVELVISDNGVGIPKDILKKLGKYKVSYGKNNGPSGSGQGVFYAREIVVKSKGKFSIDSTVGIGTTVKMLFKTVDLKKPS